jgi:hypothetical protein
MAEMTPLEVREALTHGQDRDGSTLNEKDVTDARLVLMRQFYID